MREESLREEMLGRGLEDILQLLEIVSIVSFHTEIEMVDESALLAPTIEVIRDLVEPGWAIAGNAVQDTNGYAVVDSWKLTSAEAIARIEEDWKALQEPLDFGNVVWIELTNAGRTEAQRVLGDG